MKRILKIAFLLLILLSSKNAFALEDDIYITNNKGVDMTEERFLELLDAGYTLNDVYNMTQNEYNNANTNNPNIIVDTKYYKTTTSTRYGKVEENTEEVTKEEYDNSPEITPNSSLRISGYVATTYKKLTVTIDQSSTNTGKMNYKAYMHWKTMPSVRSNDIITLGFDPLYVKIYTGPFFTYLYTVNGYTYTTQSCSMKEFRAAVGAVFELHEDAKTLNQELTFDIMKVDTSSTLTSLKAVGDYAHATETVSRNTANNNYTAGMLGISLGSSILNKYDAMSEAQVYWEGTW